MAFRKGDAVSAVTAGATVYFLPRSGLEAAIPAVGGIGAPIIMIGVGLALVAVVGIDGDAGAALRGVGYGLVALGALGFGASK